jgi:hypothetical protein
LGGVRWDDGGSDDDDDERYNFIDETMIIM